MSISHCTMRRLRTLSEGNRGNLTVFFCSFRGCGSCCCCWQIQIFTKRHWCYRIWRRFLDKIRGVLLEFPAQKILEMILSVWVRKTNAVLGCKRKNFGKMFVCFPLCWILQLQTQLRTGEISLSSNPTMQCSGRVYFFKGMTSKSQSVVLSQKLAKQWSNSL